MWIFIHGFLILLVFGGILENVRGLDKSWLVKYGEVEVKKGDNSSVFAKLSSQGRAEGEESERGMLMPGTFLLEESGVQELYGKKEVVLFRGNAGGRASTPKPSVVVNEEDKKIRRDWGGNCTNYHWLLCVNQTTFGKDVYDEETKEQIGFQLNCADQDLFPPVCMFNGWTVTRCHLLCMSKECNRDLKLNYDEYVSKDGFC